MAITAPWPSRASSLKRLWPGCSPLRCMPLPATDTAGEDLGRGPWMTTMRKACCIQWMVIAHLFLAGLEANVLHVCLYAVIATFSTPSR